MNSLGFQSKSLAGKDLSGGRSRSSALRTHANPERLLPRQQKPFAAKSVGMSNDATSIPATVVEVIAQ